MPFAYWNKLKVKLDLLKSQNIIAPITEATTWCASIVITPKKNSQNIHMWVSLSHLSCFAIWERYQSFNPSQAVADIAAGDAKYNLYHSQCTKGLPSVPLGKRQPSTDHMPVGRYNCLHAPCGISLISEHYHIVYGSTIYRDHEGLGILAWSIWRHFWAWLSLTNAPKVSESKYQAGFGVIIST